MNRKLRRAAASTKGRKKMGTNGKQEMTSTVAKELTPDERMERLNKMLAGKIEPSNEMVCYFVDQMRKVSADADAVRKNLQQYRDMATQLEARARELQGMQKKCIEDINHWDKPPTRTGDGEVNADVVETSKGHEDGARPSV